MKYGITLPSHNLNFVLSKEDVDKILLGKTIKITCHREYPSVSRNYYNPEKNAFDTVIADPKKTYASPAFALYNEDGKFEDYEDGKYLVQFITISMSKD